MDRFLLKTDDIFICGGNDGNSILKTLEVYNYRTKKVKQLCPMSIARDEMALVSTGDGYLYAIGGFGGQNNVCLSQVERYSLERNTWEPMADLSIPRRALSAVSIGGSVFVLGGFDGENYLSSVEKLDTGKNRWEKMSPMKHGRCTLSAVVSEDFQYIYAIGGFDNGSLSQIER
jgi:influenza virus NS1A-binding protein